MSNGSFNLVFCLIISSDWQFKGNLYPFLSKNILPQIFSLSLSSLRSVLYNSPYHDCKKYTRIWTFGSHNQSSLNCFNSRSPIFFFSIALWFEHHMHDSQMTFKFKKDELELSGKRWCESAAEYCLHSCEVKSQPWYSPVIIVRIKVGVSPSLCRANSSLWDFERQFECMIDLYNELGCQRMNKSSTNSPMGYPGGMESLVG